MRLLRYLTHPQVRIDPAVEVPAWGLSDVGRVRVEALAGAGWLAGTRHVCSSAERKALETAEPIAAALGLTVEVRAAMHENDRSATGFLAPAEFETVADAFFAKPDQSIRGWETARCAQARIVREADAVLADKLTGDILFVGHGAVGTLLYCHFGDLAISRAHDQSAGGGHYWTVELDARRVVHAWRPIEIAP